MDHIRIHGLRTWANHGVQPAEREQGQPFVIHVDLQLDLAPAAASDDLADTVDYGTLSARVRDVVRGGPYDLIETVAGRVLDLCMGDPRVRAAEVTVEKPHAPLPAPADGVSVTLRREKTGG
jgi:7,8-dihydroneopterin aldolase/epimerase/oxygenase